MPRFLTIILLSELLVACVVGQTRFVYRDKQGEVFLTFKASPTPENARALHTQVGVDALHRLEISGAIFIGMAGLTLAGFYIRRHRLTGGHSPEAP